MPIWTYIAELCYDTARKQSKRQMEKKKGGLGQGRQGGTSEREAGGTLSEEYQAESVMPTRPGHCILNPSRFLFWIGGDGAVGGQQSIAAERRGFMKPENAYTNLELQPLPYVLLLTSAAPSSMQGPVSCWYLLFCRAPWTSTVQPAKVACLMNGVIAAFCIVCQGDRTPAGETGGQGIGAETGEHAPRSFIRPTPGRPLGTQSIVGREGERSSPNNPTPKD